MSRGADVPQVPDGWLPPHAGGGPTVSGDRSLMPLVTWRPLRGPFWWLVVVVLAVVTEMARLAPTGSVPGVAICGVALIGLALFGGALAITDRLAGTAPRGTEP